MPAHSRMRKKGQKGPETHRSTGARTVRRLVKSKSIAACQPVRFPNPRHEGLSTKTAQRIRSFAAPRSSSDGLCFRIAPQCLTLTEPEGHGRCAADRDGVSPRVSIIVAKTFRRRRVSRIPEDRSHALRPSRPRTRTVLTESESLSLSQAAVPPLFAPRQCLVRVTSLCCFRIGLPT